MISITVMFPQLAQVTNQIHYFKYLTWLSHHFYLVLEQQIMFSLEDAGVSPAPLRLCCEWTEAENSSKPQTHSKKSKGKTKGKYDLKLA